MTFVLGLTGGIASGKSLVTSIFLKEKIPVVDGDLVSRKIVEKNSPALKEIVAYFGEDILQADGTLNRKILGKRVFAKKELLQKLNDIMDPYLRNAFLKEINGAKEKNIPLIVLDIPLLYEENYDQYCEQVMVVWVPENIQKNRLMKRDQLTEIEAEKRMASQLSLNEKKRLGDIIIDNSATKRKTEEQVLKWLKNFQEKTEKTSPL